MRIGVLGTGTIAAAVVRGIAGDGHEITVSERSATQARALSRDYDSVAVADNQTVLDQSDVVFLGLMAEVAHELLPGLTFRADQRVISFMAGASLEQVAALVAPARAEAVVMPFPGIARGGSPVLVRGEVALATQLFGASNTIFAASSDAELAAFLSAQAVLSPVARLVETAGTWLGQRVSDPVEAERFLRVLVSSSLDGTSSQELIALLNTPGGYNQRLRQHMETEGMVSALIAGMDRLEQDA